MYELHQIVHITYGVNEIHKQTYTYIYTKILQCHHIIILLIEFLQDLSSPTFGLQQNAPADLELPANLDFLLDNTFSSTAAEEAAMEAVADATQGHIPTQMLQKGPKLAVP